ncbi:hypothetical protein DI09_229p10 [Mitosporidium daphniae]|uniref:Uncharacterized protein n=1 Tax=Mitosporidium daphniae TaxID=1485682 RepID=A0A098VSQ5_9MICR|nr:uncharacterized protein DI09_229p10 [Mitosporidium daphniae]KGG52005.1 hypothetical protein DI09_229p10 [Mitosporidium daphniae]|eukprot:XP_013238441.1 uncharacterized protein DI09_229p10 [Mitosporidium daphniae]
MSTAKLLFLIAFLAILALPSLESGADATGDRLEALICIQALVAEQLELAQQIRISLRIITDEQNRLNEKLENIKLDLDAIFSQPNQLNPDQEEAMKAQLTQQVLKIQQEMKAVEALKTEQNLKFLQFEQAQESLENLQVLPNVPQ